MKKIQSFSSSSNGMNAWSDRTIWYVCESEEEYAKALAEYEAEYAEYRRKYMEAVARHGNEQWWMWDYPDWNAAFVYHNWSFDAEIDISSEPKHRCSDGWHYYEGKHIRGRGFRVYKMYERSSESFYVMHPDAEIRDCDYEEWLG